MEQPNPQSSKQNTEEMDLSQLFQLFGTGLKKISRGILKTFVYLRKKAIILLGLIILGLVIGYILNNTVSQKMKIEIIVKPNLETKDYLYDVINEIQSNLKSRNFNFFNNWALQTEDLSGLSIEIAKLYEPSEDVEDELAYLEMLLSTNNADLISDVVRAEILNRSSFSHRITIFFKDHEIGEAFAEKVISYINSNQYFQQLVEINEANAKIRIEENKTLIKQIDNILSNYSDQLGKESSEISNGKIYLGSEDGLDVPGLLSWKSRLIKENEDKKLELLAQQDAITILNFGKSQSVQRPLIINGLIIVPLILLTLFFLVELIKYLNRKAIENDIT